MISISPFSGMEVPSPASIRSAEKSPNFTFLYVSAGKIPKPAFPSISFFSPISALCPVSYTHLDVYKRQVYSSRVDMEQIELLQEEIDSQHDEKDESQQSYLSGCYLHELAEIVIIKLPLGFLLFRRKAFSHEGLRKFAEKVVVLCSFLFILCKRIIFVVFFFRSGIACIRRHFFLEYIRSPDGHEYDIVDDGKDDEPHYHPYEDPVSYTHLMCLKRTSS